MSAGWLAPGRPRWMCPVCAAPVGKSNGNGLSRHGTPKCSGTGTEVAILDPASDVAPEVPLPTWIPPPIPFDPAPFRRWRALGWTSEQIAAVTGNGALW